MNNHAGGGAMSQPSAPEGWRIVMAIQADNCANMVADPEGDSPACKPALGTSTCERCGGDVRQRKGACPAVPPDLRWRFKALGAGE